LLPTVLTLLVLIVVVGSLLR